MRIPAAGRAWGKEGQLKPPCPALCFSPSLTSPCCVLGTRCPCSGSHTGFRGSLCPWKSISVSSLPRDRPSLLPNQRSRAAGAAEPDPDSFPALVSGGTNDSLWVGPTKTHTKTSLREQGGPFGTVFERALGKLPGSRSQVSHPCEGKHHWDTASSAVSFMGMVPRGAGADGSPGELLPGGFSASQPAALCLLYTADFFFPALPHGEFKTWNWEPGDWCCLGLGKSHGQPFSSEVQPGWRGRHSPAGCIYQCSTP